MPLTITSPAFEDGGRIPDRHARKGQNLSPPLNWSGVPDGAQSLALIVEDPDAPGGTFFHWAAFDIPPTSRELPEGAGAGSAEIGGQGRNDFGESGYGGPQPPKGHGVHHYHFRLFALDVAELDVPDGTPVKAVLDKARRHALAEAELVGTYER